MSDIAEIIKEIAARGDKTSTFPAVVSDNEPVITDGKTQYVVSVRVLLPSEDYNTVKNELTSDTDDSSGGINPLFNDEPEAKIELHNVRLRANINGEDEGVIVIPRVGSWVLVSIIDNNDAKTYIVKYSEIDRVIVRIKKPVSQDASGGTDDQEPEYFDIDFDSSNLTLKFGDLFKTVINNEEVNLKFLQPKEQNSSNITPQKVLSELTYVKDNLDLTFLDDDEKPRANIHADQENFTIDFLENEEVKLSTQLNKDKASVLVTDGCSVEVEKDKAKLSTDGGAEEITLDKNTGLSLKSGSNITIQAQGSVDISGSSVNIN